MILLAIAFSIPLASLIWARYFFFIVRSKSKTSIKLAYDLIVSVQILGTYFLIAFGEIRPLLIQIIAVVAYTLATAFFFWSILTAKKLEFAFSDNVGTLITNGPFKFVRHPFYTSYIVIWATNTILFNSLLLWISFVALVAFYYLSALKEESLILKSTFAEDYTVMRQNVGMFLPKVTQWNRLHSKKSAKKQK